MNMLKDLAGALTPPQTQQTSNGGNFLSMMENFNSFKKSINGRDPKAILQNMIDSGKVTPEQVERARSMAVQFQGLLR